MALLLDLQADAGVPLLRILLVLGRRVENAARVLHQLSVWHSLQEALVELLSGRHGYERTRHECALRKRRRVDNMGKALSDTGRRVYSEVHVEPERRKWFSPVREMRERGELAIGHRLQRR